jgi:hypothetical protein
LIYPNGGELRLPAVVPVVEGGGGIAELKLPGVGIPLKRINVDSISFLMIIKFIPCLRLVLFDYFEYVRSMQVSLEELGAELVFDKDLQPLFF